MRWSQALIPTQKESPADAVAPLIPSACKRRDDQVLRGLAVLGGIPLRRGG